MAKSAKDRQRDFRQRQAQQIARAASMQAALEEIVGKLKESTKPAAIAVREIAERGLAG